VAKHVRVRPLNLDSGGLGQSPEAVGGRMPIHWDTAAVQQDRPAVSVACCLVDGPADRWRRALEVQASLWRSGRMRAVGLPGLLIAAVAGREGVTVMHYDSDYDFIAQAAGALITQFQAVEASTEPGSAGTQSSGYLRAVAGCCQLQNVVACR
jgi:hypothetical protein